MAEHFTLIDVARYGVNVRYTAQCSCGWTSSHGHTSRWFAQVAIDSHTNAQSEVSNARRLDRDEETAALEGFRPMEGVKDDPD